MLKPYEKQYRDQTVYAGQRTVLALGFPARCQLSKLVIKQTGPAGMVNFTVDIFNARKAGSVSASSGGADPEGEYTLDPDAYRVCPTIPSDEAGKLMKFWNNDGPVYENQDGGPTSKLHRIYLEIEVPSGAGEVTLDISLACLLPR